MFSRRWTVVGLLGILCPALAASAAESRLSAAPSVAAPTSLAEHIAARLDRLSGQTIDRVPELLPELMREAASAPERAPAFGPAASRVVLLMLAHPGLADVLRESVPGLDTVRLARFKEWAETGQRTRRGRMDWEPTGPIGAGEEERADRFLRSYRELDQHVASLSRAANPADAAARLDAIFAETLRSGGVTLASDDAEIKALDRRAASKPDAPTAIVPVVATPPPTPEHLLQDAQAAVSAFLHATGSERRSRLDTLRIAATNSLNLSRASLDYELEPKAALWHAYAEGFLKGLKTASTFGEKLEVLDVVDRVYSGYEAIPLETKTLLIRGIVDDMRAASAEEPGHGAYVRRALEVAVHVANARHVVVQPGDLDRARGLARGELESAAKHPDLSVYHSEIDSALAALSTTAPVAQTPKRRRAHDDWALESALLFAGLMCLPFSSVPLFLLLAALLGNRLQTAPPLPKPSPALPPATKFDQLNALFEQGVAPQVEDLIGLHPGRGFIRSSPDSPLAQLLAGRMDEDFDPLFGRILHLGLMEAPKLSPDFYDDPVHAREEAASNLFSDFSTPQQAVSGITMTYLPGKCAWEFRRSGEYLVARGVQKGVIAKVAYFFKRHELKSTPDAPLPPSPSRP